VEQVTVLRFAASPSSSGLFAPTPDRPAFGRFGGHWATLFQRPGVVPNAWHELSNQQAERQHVGYSAQSRQDESSSPGEEGAIYPTERNVRILGIVAGSRPTGPIAWSSVVSSAEVSWMSGGGPGLVLARAFRYDLIVVDYPLRDLALGSFFDALDAEESASSGTAVVVCHQGTPDSALSQAHLRPLVDVVRSEKTAELRGVIGRVVGPLLRRQAVVVAEVVDNTTDRRFLCQTRDLSTHGLFLVSAREWTRGDRISIALRLEEGRQPVMIAGEVVRLSPAGEERPRGVGVRFVRFMADGEKWLGHFLAARLAADVAQLPSGC